ncbi:xanthine dehydrogenase accessory protein XdhC [Kistimonas scapharcae]|uniref:Xanthine dehydrogenase accessory protein XdhC n=1 Tax=Kistimonas scapharcae TaxID=1036133 RepID=A0ABP8V2M2_9GAMM
MTVKRWFDAVQNCEQTGIAYVLATILGTTGSTPRDPGSKMVISADATFDTLGGGHLELDITKKARTLLDNGIAGNHLEHFPLGARLGQCCGGSVTVLLECFIQPGLNLALFGAGHVAQALVTILGGLPGPVRWIDNRPDMVPETTPANVRFFLEEDPVDFVETLPANSQVLILTHSHALDFELVKAALQRKDCSYIGCIGSKAKAKRFQTRLLHQGYSQTHIAQLNCPVGHPDIPGKRPMEVAVSIAASLIALINNNINQPAEIRSHGIEIHKQIVKTLSCQ